MATEAADRDPFDATGEGNRPTFQVLEATDGAVVAIRSGTATTAGYRELYELLVEVTRVHGTVHVYEEFPDWGFWTFLSQVHGIVPDLTYGPDLEIGRYAAVGDSRWGSLTYYLWKAIAPLWPVSPEEMQLFDLEQREAALAWVRADEQDA